MPVSGTGPLITKSMADKQYFIAKGELEDHIIDTVTGDYAWVITLDGKRQVIEHGFFGFDIAAPSKRAATRIANRRLKGTKLTKLEVTLQTIKS